MTRPNDTAQGSGNAGAYSNIVFLTLIWGSTFLLTDMALDAFTPVQITSLRLLIGAFSLTPILLIPGQARRLNRVDWVWLFFFSLCGQALPLLALAWSQQYVPSGLAAIFFSTIPLFVLLLARVVLREEITRRKWIGFLIGFAGLLVLIGPAALRGLGSALFAQCVLLGSCFLYACSSIMLRRMPATPPVQVTAISLILAALILSPLGLRSALETGTGVAISSTELSDLAPLGAVLALGMILSGLGQALRTLTISRVGPVFYSVIGYMVPVWACFLGVMVLGESMTLEQVLSFGLILFGLIVAQTSGKPKNG